MSTDLYFILRGQVAVSLPNPGYKPNDKSVLKSGNRSSKNSSFRSNNSARPSARAAQRRNENTNNKSSQRRQETAIAQKRVGNLEPMNM